MQLRIESLRVEYCNCVNAIEFQMLEQIWDEDHQEMVQSQLENAQSNLSTTEE